MPKLEWSDRLSVGVPELDEDHRTLIQIINNLRGYKEGEMRPKDIDRCLKALVRYAEWHFAREERVMAACGYTSLPGHHEEHERFVAELAEVARKFRADPEGASDLVGEELQGFLENWLIKHILVVDMDYKPVVAGKRAASDAAKSLKGSEVQRITI